jgi:hypothetical protein
LSAATATTLTMMTAPAGAAIRHPSPAAADMVCTEVANASAFYRLATIWRPIWPSWLAQHWREARRHHAPETRHDDAFSSVISCHYEGKDSFVLQNVLLADKVDWWTPQNPEEAGQWQSSLMLSEPFFRVHRTRLALRHAGRAWPSPVAACPRYLRLAHYRMSYLSKRTTIPWVALAGQFGSGYAMTEQGLRDFKRAFCAS